MYFNPHLIELVNSAHERAKSRGQEKVCPTNYLYFLLGGMSYYASVGATRSLNIQQDALQRAIRNNGYPKSNRKIRSVTAPSVMSKVSNDAYLIAESWECEYVSTLAYLIAFLHQDIVVVNATLDELQLTPQQLLDATEIYKTTKTQKELMRLL